MNCVRVRSAREWICSSLRLRSSLKENDMGWNGFLLSGLDT